MIKVYETPYLDKSMTSDISIMYLGKVSAQSTQCHHSFDIYSPPLNKGTFFKRTEYFLQLCEDPNRQYHQPES